MDPDSSVELIRRAQAGEGDALERLLERYLPDLRRWALAHALLAPSSHNRQPWLVDLREPNAITLHVDRERLLPETDPWFRQIVVSQGTFLEALVLALGARGVAPRVAHFPEGEFAPRTLDNRPVARITWSPSGNAARDPLFDQLLHRHTAKVDYGTTRPVAGSTRHSPREGPTTWDANPPWMSLPGIFWPRQIGARPRSQRSHLPHGSLRSR